MEIEAVMTNEELQQCIIHTNDMIKNTPKDAERMSALNRHFNKLLDIQAARAAQISLDD